jgi:hypothetical protein
LATLGKNPYVRGYGYLCIYWLSLKVAKIANLSQLATFVEGLAMLETGPKPRRRQGMTKPSSRATDCELCGEAENICRCELIIVCAEDIEMTAPKSPSPHTRRQKTEKSLV